MSLQQHLLVNSGETKLVQQRSSRLLKQQEKSLGYLLVILIIVQADILNMQPYIIHVLTISCSMTCMVNYCIKRITFCIIIMHSLCVSLGPWVIDWHNKEGEAWSSIGKSLSTASRDWFTRSCNTNTCNHYNNEFHRPDTAQYFTLETG